MIIYKTTNLVNKKFYIGKDKHNNPNYLGSGELILKAIKKYGKHNFKKEILEECENIKDMANRERFWIEKLDMQASKL
jgi:group I intron endonuclease